VPVQMGMPFRKLDLSLADLRKMAADYEKKAQEEPDIARSRNCLQIRDCLLDLVSLHEQLHANLRRGED
jgi:hypothetical protein